MDSDDTRPLATIRLHPFAIVIGSFLVALAGREVWTVNLVWAPPVAVATLGTGLIVLGVLTLHLAYWALARARTTIDPRVHTTTIVTTGIYRLSRNPIYLGWFLLTLGFGVKNLSLFPTSVSVLMVGLLHWAVVIREETYLEQTFGDEYLRYKKTVRRWI